MGKVLHLTCNAAASDSASMSKNAQTWPTPVTVQRAFINDVERTC